MNSRIAIVGAACRYPDAASLDELWETVVGQRQAFRRMPPERLPMDDYWSSDRSAPARTYSRNAAVLTNWTFDRAKYRVSRSTFESADLAHWLALEIADAALQDSGITPPAESTGVIVGNTLTGDSSRADSLRLRWPYVRRAAEDAGADAELIARLEEEFNRPFAEIGEDTLAGGLANTIAGRICNYFGFNGGGYIVDGACSSSLLAIIHACNALAAGDLDVAIAGGVDLSLDPFELVGFAKSSALARERMWVYDRKANGFLPGEGCGLVVLMRHDDAVREGRRIYATLAGWAMSSDGHGGMTRPERAGQTIALRRAYAKAGVPIGGVTLFEGHGTGTPVGDPIEIGAIASLIGSDRAHPRFIGSIKANIGHTKAAAGVAGLLKAALALHHGVIPPATACNEPREELAAGDAPLRVANVPLPWPENAPRRAAVSAMGFGGINTHIVLEGVTETRPSNLPRVSPREDAEVFLLGGATSEDVRALLDRIAGRAPEMSLAEMGDLAASLRSTIVGRWRAAFVASTPEELFERATSAEIVDAAERPRIGFLFSGQGSIPNLTTDRAQPAIVRASLEKLRRLRELGIEAVAAAGHSLGELTALHWSGALGESQLLELASFRGDAMQRLAGDGAMAALGCDEATALRLAGDDAVVAATNAPEQTVVSGAGAAIDRAIERARANGVTATRVAVSAAFHSPAMAPAAEPLRDFVRGVAPQTIARPVVSTVTGDRLPADTDLAELLATQLTAPVRFREAVDRLASETDLLIEVGPGRLLANVVATFANVPVVVTERIADAVAAAWLAGCEVDLEALFEGRITRPFDLDTRPSFIVSPTERGRAARASVPRASIEREEPREQTREEVREEIRDVPLPRAAGEATPGLLRDLVAKHVELPLHLVAPSSRLLSDLHLSSITVARLLADAARAMGVPPLSDPTSLANATIDEATAALESLRGSAAPESESRFPDGVDTWVRAFRIDPVPLQRAAATRRNDSESSWRVLGGWPEAAERFASVQGRGIVAVLPPDDYDACMNLLLDCRTIADGERLVVVQQAPCGAGFARTLHIERPSVSVRIVNVPRLDAEALEFAAAEAEARGDFAEATLGDDGIRYEPRARVCEGVDDADAAPLAPDDVLLVTGGGRGIGFETAFELARSSGARLILLGRSREGEELRANLARLDAAEIPFRYIAADVTSAGSVRDALADAGRITAILHAAGTNAPALLDALDAGSFRAATAPKIDGLQNILAAVDPESLRLLVTFGSVIARTGMRGEAHYAFANEWLARLTSEFAASHPPCRTICMEWSVWSGVGMGERLGTIDMLRRQGIAPVTQERAIALTRALAAAPPAPNVIACGRMGDPPTLRFDDAPPPLLRFVEETRVSVPGVELVCDAALSDRNDPYLADHAFAGEPLLPAVVGLEAMCQIARTVSGKLPSRISNVELLRPVTVAKVRVASLVRGSEVDLVLRSSETQFQLDHFRATLSTEPRPERPRIEIAPGHVALDPERDLYETLLFHTGRFRRIRAYRLLTATECVAELTPSPEPFFHRHQPADLLLGDATIRDAAIHALQACVPQATVLPSGFASIELFAPVEGDAIVVARETARDADSFVYDVDLASPDGLLFERWRGLKLQVVARRERVDDLAPALWAPFLEREIGIRVEIGANGATTDEIIRRAARSPRLPVRREDGKPLVDNAHVSASHDGGVTLAVADASPVGCDLQAVDSQPWDELIARDRALTDVCADASGDARPFAAARIWSAREAMKKLAGDALVPLVLESRGDHRRITFRSGGHHIDTFVIRDRVVAVARTLERRG